MQKNKKIILQLKHVSLLPYLLLAIGIVFGFIRFDNKLKVNFILEWLFLSFVIWIYVALKTGVVRDKALSKVYRNSEPAVYWIYIALNMLIVFVLLLCVLLKWTGFYPKSNP